MSHSGLPATAKLHPLLQGGYCVLTSLMKRVYIRCFGWQ